MNKNRDVPVSYVEIIPAPQGKSTGCTNIKNITILFLKQRDPPAIASMRFLRRCGRGSRAGEKEASDDSYSPLPDNGRVPQLKSRP